MSEKRLRPLLTTALAGVALTAAAIWMVERGPADTDHLPPMAAAAEEAPAATDGATDIAPLTGPQRQAFRAEVRAYLMEHPEVLLEAIQVLENRQQDQQVEAETAMVRDNAEAIFNDDHSWVGGNPDGDITVVEFMDYRCGYCRKAFEEVEELVDTDGDIRFVLKEFPILGEDSLAASRLAIATQLVAGDDAYKDMHDALMAYGGGFDRVSSTRLLEQLDIDPEPVLAEIDSDAVSAVIAQNRALAQKLQITGTPTFVMPDTMLRGYVPLDGMRAIVAELRAE